MLNLFIFVVNFILSYIYIVIKKDKKKYMYPVIIIWCIYILYVLFFKEPRC